MSAARYTVTRTAEAGIEVLRLADAEKRTAVSIAPGFGNNAYAMTVNGKDILWTPASLVKMRADQAFGGTFLMAPWANRLSWDGFEANGRKYSLDRTRGNFRRDDNGLPIHGLIAFSSDWEFVALEADGNSAWASSRLDFRRHPDLLAQFPFALVIAITHRLRDGTLEVETVIENRGTEPMPVALGFHPFFRLHDSPRREWRVSVPAREQMSVSDGFLPTGKATPLALPARSPLAGMDIAYIMSSLTRRADGRAEFRLEGRRERISIFQGPRYPLSVFYAPPERDFVCFEPMAATVNAMNPALDGRAQAFPTVAPGGAWRESFWIEAEGF